MIPAILALAVQLLGKVDLDSPAQDAPKVVETTTDCATEIYPTFEVNGDE